MVGSKISSGSSIQRPGGTSRDRSAPASTSAQRRSGVAEEGNSPPIPTMATRGEIDICCFLWIGRGNGESAPHREGARDP